jgi:hypothetical protein
MNKEIESLKRTITETILTIGQLTDITEKLSNRLFQLELKVVKLEVEKTKPN